MIEKIFTVSVVLLCIMFMIAKYSDAKEGSIELYQDIFGEN
jgi:hypothetical protein